MKRIRPPRRSDDGAVLVIALVIVTTVALVTGALLTKGSGNFLATVSLRQVAGTAYAGDAAAKIAINDMVMGKTPEVPDVTYPSGTPNGWVYDNNSDGSGCFGISSGAPLTTIPLTNTYQQPDGTFVSATVTCRPVVGTGLFGSGGGTVILPPSPNSASARALTTVGTSGSTSGINLKVLGIGALPVRGGIASMSTINVTNGPVFTNGTIVANNSPCTTSGGGSITPACTYGGVTAPDDPGSPVAGMMPATSALPYQNPLSEGCTFAPGYYNNGTLLSQAVNACSTARFTSGVYYFDFTDGNPWNIATTVMGGEPGAQTDIPGGCASPIFNPLTAGVQFVFGGSSALSIGDNAKVELCGPAQGGAAPITIYQQQQSSPPPIPISLPATGGAAAGKVTTLPSVNNSRDAFTPADSSALTSALAGTDAPNTTATWKSTKKNNVGELDLTSFPGMANIPVGSTITSAQLNVVWSSPASAPVQAAVAGQAPVTSLAASGADTDITSAMNSAFDGTNGSFNPAIRLMVSDSAKDDVATFDSARLRITYVAPALHAATAGTFMSTGNNFSGKFVVQGATYAPQGYISMGPGNATGALVAFRWGLVAFGVNFKAQPQQLFGVPLVSIPDPGDGLGSDVTAVDLTVYVCPGSLACPTSGSPALTSRVQFKDGTTSAGVINPIPGQRQVKVLSWSEQR